MVFILHINHDMCTFTRVNPVPSFLKHSTINIHSMALNECVCVLVHVCVCVGVCVSENIATTQPDRKVCVSNCSNGRGETLWAWPAPEVWTDGCSGVHRKVFGVSVVLMFMASWLLLSQAYQRDRMRHEKQTKQNHKSVFVCVHVCLSLSVSAIFCFLFALLWLSNSRPRS